MLRSQGLPGLVLLVASFASFSACTSAPGEGIAGCNRPEDCPASVPFCRADMRCWSTTGPGADASASDASLPDVGTDASAADVEASLIDAGVDGPLDAFAAGDSATDDDTGAIGMDSGPVGDSGATGADVGTTDSAGRDAATTTGDGGGPCAGLPMSTYYRDADNDGHGAIAGLTTMRCAAGGGYVASNDDCNDADDTRYPGAPELCNSIDDNCDGTPDGAVADSSCVISHGAGRCLGGACEVASCTAPFGDCDFVDANGCEVDTSTSARDCGGCAMRCGAALTCGASACVPSAVVQVSIGFNHGCLRRANGGLACWSRENSLGYIGDGTVAGTGAPVSVLTNTIDVFAGENMTWAVRGDGTVWGWGYRGGRFVATSPTDPTPTAIPGIVDGVQVVATNASACARRATGRVVCWDASSAPVAVSGMADAVLLATGRGGGVCAIRSTGGVACWSGPFGATPAAPAALAGVSNATDVAVVLNTVCVRRADGSVACHWGGSPTPDQRPSVTPTGVDEIVGGYQHFCVRAGTTVSCWGLNGQGQLGDGTNVDRMLPGSVTGISTATALGGAFLQSTCAILSTGTVRCWGLNNYGQLGDGTSVDRNVPVLVLGL